MKQAQIKNRSERREDGRPGSQNPFCLNFWNLGSIVIKTHIIPWPLKKDAVSQDKRDL